MSFLEADLSRDPYENLHETLALFQGKLNISPQKPELELIRRLAELIGTRAARLTACGIAALCTKQGWKSVHVGADGSVFNKYPHFKKRQAQALKEILDWEDRFGNGRGDPVEVVAAQDGSGVGAALIAALTIRRVAEGNLAGVRDHKGLKERLLDI
jgi:hexokinase